MSQDKPTAGKRVQIEAVLAALNARDFDALADMPFHPDMELQSVVAAVEGGVYYGLHGLREWAKDLDSTFDDFRVQLVEFREVGAEGAVVALQNSGNAKASGIPLLAKTYLVCRWRNGLMWRIRSFMDHAEALEAVGVSE